MITFDDGYVDIGRHALPLLTRCGMTATVFVVTGSLGGEDGWNDELGGDRLRLLNRSEIADWATQGIEFGAHGRTHRDLTLLDADELASEVEGSRSDLADLLGAPPHAFAYPFGSHDRRVIEVVRKTFSLAFTTNEGLHGEGGNPLRVPRVPVLSRDGTTDLFLDVTFGSSVLNHLKRRLFLGKRRIVTRSKSLFRRRTMGRAS
jgi:peptidoglycan/xylan/chitin deacetylase (PgdA/CDA1 family)